ncbi:ATP-binding protein, partial [Curtobacterium flaccumfaciens]|uniref:ATP-binding protein n=1 Tax=Curtobacterium flaccumfaciens TaxID=2035 RepID=UPI003CF35EEF
TLHLSVMDSGPGVPADAADSLFVRGPAAAPASEDVSQVHGLGIGLPLSLEIARRHGGDVWRASPGGADHGAVFCARLEGVVS